MGGIPLPGVDVRVYDRRIVVFFEAAMKKINVVRILVAAGLLALLGAGFASADEAERCRNSCAVDLKSCRGQAETTANYEAHPLLSDRSKSAVYGNGQLSPSIHDGGGSASPDAEVQRRKQERYQDCATENRDCQKLCVPAQDRSERSLILR